MEILGRSDWILTYKGSPCTPSLRKAQRNAHCRDYKRIRDASHQDEETLWKHASVSYAADVWDFKRLSQSARARANRIIYNKYWFPWNTARLGITFDDVIMDGLCPLCGEPDSLAHLIYECNDVSCARIRRFGRRAINLCMQQYENNESGQELNTALNSMLWSTDMASTWTGVWYREQRERLHDMLRHRNSLITSDHTKRGRGAAIQLRDINMAMAATISLLTGLQAILR